MLKLNLRKRLGSLCIATAMVLSLVACQSSSAPASTAVPPSPPPEITASPAVSSVPAEAKLAPLQGDTYGSGSQGTNGGVASSSMYASQIGVDILKAGGNAVDAAVATVFAIGVAEPEMSGVGGCGLMNVYLAKDNKRSILDFMETTPLASHPGMIDVKNPADIYSGKNVAVPGQVHGLLTALEKYGTMTPEQVIAPAIKLAQDGYLVDKNLYDFIGMTYDKLLNNAELKSLYTNEGVPLNVGDTIKNPNLAKTLTAISKGGIKEFYEGDTAKAIVAGLQKTGSLITLEDLAAYRTIEREPISTTFQGYEVVTSPPPSQGGMWLLEMLNILDTYDMKAMGLNTPEYIFTQCEASRLGMADGGAYIGDPAFFDLPTATIISPEYAAQRKKQITDKAFELAPAGELKVTRLNATADTSKHTSHVSVMDKDGNVVSITTTLGNMFGSAVAIDGMGFAFNSHIANLEHDPAKSDSSDYIMPGKRVRTSIAPTIVFQDGKPVIAVGSPGSNAITPAIASALCNMILFDMNAHEAINAPRANVTLPNNMLCVEVHQFDEATQKALGDMGYQVYESQDALQIGCLSIVSFDKETGVYNAAGDHRRGYRGLAY